MRQICRHDFPCEKVHWQAVRMCCFKVVDITECLKYMGMRSSFDANHDCKDLIQAQLMSTDPKSVFPHMRFTEAEDLMRACKINALVVKDLTGQVAGVLQIFDINNE
jgi:CBS domain-containing protein